MSNYLVKFVGGPLDGSGDLPDENNPAAFIGRVTGTPQRMAIYEYLVDREKRNRLERIYLYFKTVELNEGEAFIQKQGRVTPDQRSLYA